MKTLLKHYNEAVRQASYIFKELGTGLGYIEAIQCNVSSELLEAINKEVLKLPLAQRFALCGKLVKAYFSVYKTYNIFNGELEMVLYHFSAHEQMVLELIALAAWHGVNVFEV